MYGKYDGDVELMGTGGGVVVNFSGSSLFTRTLWLSELQTPLQLSKISHSKGIGYKPCTHSNSTY